MTGHVVGRPHRQNRHRHAAVQQRLPDRTHAAIAAGHDHEIARGAQGIAARRAVDLAERGDVPGTLDEPRQLIATGVAVPALSLWTTVMFMGSKARH